MKKPVTSVHRCRTCRCAFMVIVRDDGTSKIGLLHPRPVEMKDGEEVTGYCPSHERNQGDD